jgi:transcriptional regulator GlxA family with amidase domain
LRNLIGEAEKTPDVDIAFQFGGHRIPVTPQAAVADDLDADIIIVPELWLRPDEPMTGRYPELMDWIRRKYEGGAAIFSSCSGSIMLAEAGILDGKDATSRWGHANLFRVHYPEVRFQMGPNVLFADKTGRIVTAGGTSS